MNTPVNFELAKLLKEKSFNIDKKYQNYYIEKNYYDKNGDLNECEEQSGSLSLFEGKFSAPTIAEVVMWLYEKYGIWVSIASSCNGKEWYSRCMTASEQTWDDINKRDSIINAYRYYNSGQSSPTEAYEAAIEYTLTNLI